jgi:hypothetical protein
VKYSPKYNAEKSIANRTFSFDFQSEMLAIAQVSNANRAASQCTKFKAFPVKQIPFDQPPLLILHSGR